MIPLWMFPMAIAAGNTFVLKPSPQTPLTSDLLFAIAHSAGFPNGLLNVVHGEAATSRIADRPPGVAAVSFVGSSSAARAVQERAVRAHKRVQALGGAKNYLIVMPDAVDGATRDAVISAAFGGAGQRCLAGSVLVAVGDAGDRIAPMLAQAAAKLQLGAGADDGVEMGPVVSDDALVRINGYSSARITAGAQMLLARRQRPQGRRVLRRP